MADKNVFVLRDVCYSHGDNTAVDSLSCSLAPGRFYGIIGPNGSGKTTLLDLLMGMMAPDQGGIFLDGRPLSHYSRRQLARRVALVPQEFQIHFGFTVRDVVLMGRHPYLARFDRPRAVDYRLVDQAMDALGVGEFRDRLITELSGGEKQRVVVARALAQDTPILLLDEATSNMDIHHALRILNAGHRLVREGGRTVVAVLHNLNLAAAFCDELLMLDQGRLHVFDSPDKVLSNANIRKVFGVEARGRHDDYAARWQVSYRYFDGGVRL